MLPRFKPDFDIEEIVSLINNKDDAIETFEEKFTNIVGSNYAVTFPSGRSALFALLKSLNLRNGEIIIPAFSCIVVPSAIIASDCTPCFVDISLKDYNMITQDTYSVVSNKTIAVVPTHMYGYPADVEYLRSIVGENIYIFEDAAQSILTKNVGRFGDATFYSFNYEKQIFTFGGGMVTTNNEEIYKKLLSYKKEVFSKTMFKVELTRTISLLFTKMIFSDLLFYLFSKIWDIRGSLIWKGRHWDLKDKNLPVEYIYLSNDFVDTFSKIQAAVGLAQLNKIKRNIEKRKKIAQIYNDELNDIKSIVLPPIIQDASYAHYTIRIKNRNKFEHFMKKQGIQINKVFDYSIPDIPRFKNYIKNHNTYDNSNIASKNNVNIPIYPQLLDEKYKIYRVIKSIKKYCEQSDA